MPQEESEVRSEIQAHMEKRGGEARAWYVGVAEDPRQRLFKVHKVAQGKDSWIYRTCVTARDARRVEAHFRHLGTDGTPGRTEWAETAVYAYRKTERTAP